MSGQTGGATRLASDWSNFKVLPFAGFDLPLHLNKNGIKLVLAVNQGLTVIGERQGD
jgi:hypothetical protein